MRAWLPWLLAGLGLAVWVSSLEKASRAEQAIKNVEDVAVRSSHRIDELESQVEDLESKVETLEGEMQEKADETALQDIDGRVSDLEDK